MSSASPAQDAPAPLVEEVQRIAAMTDPVIRNLRITECYHRLSVAMARRTGAAANWCTFATWASKQAGQTIRGEDLLDRLAAHARKDAEILHPIRYLWAWLVRRGLFRPETRLGRVVRAIHGPFDAFELASDAVARGNRKVFEEIGLEFARYLAQCPPDAAIESEIFQGFQRNLREGDPPDGQSLLRLAFMQYQQSVQGPDQAAQKTLLANLQIGLHEQTRLQPQIREAMEAGPDSAEELGKLVLKAFFPRFRPGAFSWPVTALLQFPASGFRKYVRDLTCRIVTESLMVMTLPGLVLDLHRHLEFPFPASLKTIDHPALVELLARFEPPSGTSGTSGTAIKTIDDCGAKDWSDLQQRIHFIIHLFRSFQEQADLFHPPFTREQVLTLMSGKVPTGDL
jgi:hypothetical protein